VVIAAVLVLGRLKVTALFLISGRAGQGEADTAATLLLALLAVVASLLVGPGAHPLASRLLLVTRLLILADSAAMLVGVGDLLLHTSPHPPVPLWSALAWVSAIVAALLTLSRLLPKGPRRRDLQALRTAAEAQLGRRALTWSAGTRTRAVTWVRKEVARTPDSERDRGGLSIPAADGYHYGDDNPWGPEERAALVAELRRVERALSARARPASREPQGPADA